MLRATRRIASAAKHSILPSPEVAAWRHACRIARRTPRYTPGTVALMDYRLRYSDLLTLCPQWDDIFVRKSMEFAATGPAPRILDCGANVGLASLYFKRRYPAARITAFEADPDLAAILSANLRDNRAADVEVVPAAVWVEDGQVAFRCEGADSGAIGAVQPAAAGTLTAVAARRLATYLAREPIDLLKLDIEGAEAAVLADCADALPAVRAAIVEIHEFDPARRVTPSVLDILSRAGFRYAFSGLTPLPWRAPAAPARAAFPAQALCWVAAVRAWRE